MVDAKNEKMSVWIGCTTRYFLPGTVKSLEKILKKLKIKYHIIDPKQMCCGSVLYNTGQRANAEKNAKEILKALRKNRVSNLVSLCPGCTRTFKERYMPKRGSGLKSVMHISEFLKEYAELLPSKRKKPLVTYHDPCHLARGLGIYDEPRLILSRVAALKEMRKNRSAGFCCGSGGGVRAYNKELSDSASDLRINEALATGATWLVTSCPFCERSLAESAKGRIKVVNLVDFIGAGH